eukprot:436555-Pyramimonas_sp.AAC.1
MYDGRPPVHLDGGDLGIVGGVQRAECGAEGVAATARGGDVGRGVLPAPPQRRVDYGPVGGEDGGRAV